jgi:hypothetical protein
MAYRTRDMDETLETRRISASIFGNEKLAEIVLLLDSEDGAVLAADLARRTGFSHSLVRDVLIRLGRTSAVRALPKTGNPRGPAYYEKDQHSPLWPALVALARAVATARVDAPLNHNEQT